MIILIMAVQLFSGLVFAAEENNEDVIQERLITQVIGTENFKSGQLNSGQLNALTSVLSKSHHGRNGIIDVDVILRDYTGNGVLDILVVYTDKHDYKYLDIYTITGNRARKIFSGEGNQLNLKRKDSQFPNIKYDGRYFYETYTYEWSQLRGRFLRVGYGKTYIRDYESGGNWRPSKPIIRDGRIKTVNDFLKERMDGRMISAEKYLSSSYKGKINADDLKMIVPYGNVTTIDIFNSQRGDWVVVVIRDFWGRSRVFKFVPVREADRYGEYKIDDIIEIQQAR